MIIFSYLLITLTSQPTLKQSITSTILSKKEYFEIPIDAKITLYLINLNKRHIEIVGYDDSDYFYYEKFLMPFPNEYLRTDQDLIAKVLNHTNKTVIHGNVGYILIHDQVNESLFTKSLKESIRHKNESLKMLHEAVQDYDEKEEFVPDYTVISDNYVQLIDILGSKDSRIKWFQIEDGKISLYVPVGIFIRMYTVDYSEINIDDKTMIKILDKVSNKSYLKEYLMKYLDIPLLKHLSNQAAIEHLDIPKNLSNQAAMNIVLDEKRENLLIYKRNEYDWIVKNDNDLESSYKINISNSVYVYLKDKVININGYEIVRDLDDTGRLLISEEEFDMFKSYCIRFNTNNLKEVEYIVYVLKDTDILEKALENIIRGYTPSLYILFVHSLYMCEIIDKTELIKLLHKEDIKSDVISRIKKNNEIFTNNYAKLLRFIIYTEINELFKEFLGGMSHDFKSEYFVDTKKYLSKENIKYDISSVDLSSIFTKSVPDLHEIFNEYDRLMDEVIPDVIDEVERSLAKK